jgi:hypothetical protein
VENALIQMDVIHIRSNEANDTCLLELKRGMSGLQVTCIFGVPPHFLAHAISALFKQLHT